MCSVTRQTWVELKFHLRKVIFPSVFFQTVYVIIYVSKSTLSDHLCLTSPDIYLQPEVIVKKSNMAEGGRSLEDPVDGNDFVYDYPCSTCEKDNRNVEAVKYCVDCDENLCSTCLSQHNKFPLMRRHKVLDQVERCHRKEKNLPSERCSKHGGKIIDIFCPNHDVVGCSTCINLDHG